jgi:hypothetical protein
VDEVHESNGACDCGRSQNVNAIPELRGSVERLVCVDEVEDDRVYGAARNRPSA